MPPGVSGRRTAPDAMDGDHHWYPTMEEFKDFKTYMEYLESQGAHEKGVALVHVSSYYIYALISNLFERKHAVENFSCFHRQKNTKNVMNTIVSLYLSPGSRRMDSSQVWIQFGGF